MLKTGAKAPDFILPNENGEEVSLSDMLETVRLPRRSRSAG